MYRFSQAWLWMNWSWEPHAIGKILHPSLGNTYVNIINESSKCELPELSSNSVVVIEPHISSCSLYHFSLKAEYQISLVMAVVAIFLRASPTPCDATCVVNHALTRKDNGNCGCSVALSRLVNDRAKNSRKVFLTSESVCLIAESCCFQSSDRNLLEALSLPGWGCIW